MITGFLATVKIASNSGIQMEKRQKYHPNADVEMINTKELFKGSRELIIEHENEFYRLIITKSGKLVLNK